MVPAVPWPDAPSGPLVDVPEQAPSWVSKVAASIVASRRAKRGELAT